MQNKGVASCSRNSNGNPDNCNDARLSVDVGVPFRKPLSLGCSCSGHAAPGEEEP